MTDEPDFRTLLESSENTPRPQRGDVLSGRVVALDTQGMIVDLGKMDAAQKAAFKQSLIDEGADMSKIQFVNE